MDEKSTQHYTPVVDRPRHQPTEVSEHVVPDLPWFTGDPDQPTQADRDRWVNELVEFGQPVRWTEWDGPGLTPVFVGPSLLDGEDVEFLVDGSGRAVELY